MIEFIHEEMRQSVQDESRIFFPWADVVRLFGDKMNMSCITAVPQEHHRPHLILNLLVQPYEGIPSVNNTIDREVAPDLIQFWLAFPHILQEIWEVNPNKVPVRVSNLDVTDAYHRGTLRPSQVGAFNQVIPLAANNYCIII